MCDKVQEVEEVLWRDQKIYSGKSVGDLKKVL